MLDCLEFYLIGLYSICISNKDLLPTGTSSKEKSIDVLFDLFESIFIIYNIKRKNNQYFKPDLNLYDRNLV